MCSHDLWYSSPSPQGNKYILPKFFYFWCKFFHSRTWYVILQKELLMMILYTKVKISSPGSKQECIFAGHQNLWSWYQSKITKWPPVLIMQFDRLSFKILLLKKLLNCLKFIMCECSCGVPWRCSFSQWIIFVLHRTLWGNDQKPFVSNCKNDGTQSYIDDQGWPFTNMILSKMTTTAWQRFAWKPMGKKCYKILCNHLAVWKAWQFRDGLYAFVLVWNPKLLSTCT